MRIHRIAAIAAGVLGLGALAACAGTTGEQEAPAPAKATGNAGAAGQEAAAPAPVKPSADGVVVMEVTSAGFVPRDVQVEVGKPVKLRITRRTDVTCAKAVVVPGLLAATDLPLDRQVEVVFTPSKSGELRYGCAMEQMVGGTIFVR